VNAKVVGALAKSVRVVERLRSAFAKVLAALARRSLAVVRKILLANLLERLTVSSAKGGGGSGKVVPGCCKGVSACNGDGNKKCEVTPNIGNTYRTSDGSLVASVSLSGLDPFIAKESSPSILCWWLAQIVEHANQCAYAQQHVCPVLQKEFPSIAEVTKDMQNKGRKGTKGLLEIYRCWISIFHNTLSVHARAKDTGTFKVEDCKSRGILVMAG